MKLKINNSYPLGHNGELNKTEYTKIVKTKDSIKCYVNNVLEVEYRGISDFNRFSIEGGEFTTEIDESQSNEILLKQIAVLTLENNKKDTIAKNLMKQVAEINLKIMKLEGAK